MEQKRAEMEQKVEQALCGIAFGAAAEGQKQASAGERLKALELLGRQYGLFGAQASADTVDLSRVSIEELRQWARG